MVTGNTPDFSILQEFVDENGDELDILLTHVDSETNVRYVLWSDIQDRFVNVRYIEKRSERMCFITNKDHQVYVSITSIFDAPQCNDMSCSCYRFQ